MISWLLILVSALFSTVGNILIKMASENWSNGNYIGLLFYVSGGILFYVLNLVGFMIALKTLNVSVAYPALASISFVFLAVGSSIILNETISKNQIFATSLIMAGLFLLVTNK